MLGYFTLFQSCIILYCYIFLLYLFLFFFRGDEVEIARILRGRSWSVTNSSVTSCDSLLGIVLVNWRDIKSFIWSRRWFTKKTRAWHENYVGRVRRAPAPLRTDRLSLPKRSHSPNRDITSEIEIAIIAGK